MNLLKNGYTIFFYLGVFFLPFNSQPLMWLGFLGEYSRESSPLFFLISFFILVIYSLARGKVFVPIKSIEYQVFILFIVTICVTTLFNLPSIIDYYFKQTTGIQRYVRQMISLSLISVFFFITFINVCKDQGVRAFFIRIRKVFFISFVIVFSCGILEFLIITYDFKALVPIIELYNYLPFVEVKLDYRWQRISSLSFEPPALSSYLLTISGFMFSYIFTSNKYSRIFPFLFVALLALLTKSRTAFVIIIVQIVFGVYYSYNKYAKFRTLFTKGVVLGFIIIVLTLIFNGKNIFMSLNERLDSLNFANNLEFKSSENAVSNKSRLGIQYANYQVFKENPIFGVGWGQQAFEARYHYPKWALKRNYEFREWYLNENVKSFPPGYNMYLRILAETGIIGTAVFFLFIYILILKVIFYYKQHSNLNYISIALLISFSGYLLNWLQIDSFRLYGFWICLAILIMLQKEYNEKTNSINSSLQ